MPRSIAKARGERQGANGMGAVGQLLALAQTQRIGLVNAPVGTTDVGLGLGTTAGAHIDKSQEATTVAPTETNGSTGFSQSSLDNQRLFVNGNFIDELALRAEQIVTGIGAIADQFWADRDTPASANSHAIEPQLNAGLATEIQHEAIAQVARQESFESNISDNGTLINGGSVVGIPDFDLSFQPTTPGGDGSLTDLKVFDLQKLSLLSLQPGTNLLQVPRLQGGQVLSIVNVAAPLRQGQGQQNLSAPQHSLSFGTLTLPPERKSVKRSDLFSPMLLTHLPPHPLPLTSHPSPIHSFDSP